MLPIPVLGIVFAIFMTGANVGQTLVTFRKVMQSCLVGNIAGGIVSNILRTVCTSEIFMALVPPLAFVGTIGLMLIPTRWLPGSNLALLFYILCLGLPALDSSGESPSHLWYFPIQLQGTLLVGALVSVLSSLLPGYAPGDWTFAWTQSRQALDACQQTATQCLQQLLIVCETNDAGALSEVFTSMSSLHVALNKADTLLPYARSEVNFWNVLCCCGFLSKYRLNSLAAHTRELRFWREQLHWLADMRKRVVGRIGEAIGQDQKQFLQRLLNPMRELVLMIGDGALRRAMFTPPSPEGALAYKRFSRLKQLLATIKEEYQQARYEVLYKEGGYRKQGMAELSKEEFFSRMRRRHAFMHAFLSFMENVSSQIRDSSHDREYSQPAQERQNKIMDQTEHKHEEAKVMEEASEENQHLLVAASDALQPTRCDCTVSPRWQRPLKMALSLTTASLWYVVPALQGHLQGVWVTVTICFVSQSDVGASTIKCFNRLIGTSLCCAYCLVCLRLYVANTMLVPVSMFVFVFAVSLFRDLPEHGYAALTAAFTTPVLLLGGEKHLSSNHVEHFIVARVEMTVLGVFLYMIFELMLWPTRPRIVIRKKTTEFLAHTSTFLEEVSVALNTVAKSTRRTHDLIMPNTPNMSAPAVVISMPSVSMPMQCFGKVVDARKTAMAALSVAQSYMMSAVNEPHLSGLIETSFPPSQWKLLHQRQHSLVSAMRRIDMAARQIEPPLRSVAPNVKTLVIGSTILRLVAEFASECAKCYEKHEQDIYAEVHPDSSDGKRKRAAIVRVSSTFFKWKDVAVRCEKIRLAFLEEIFSEYDQPSSNEFGDDDDDDDDDDGRVKDVALLASKKQEADGHSESNPVIPLEQHNQILLVAIEEAAIECLKELGSIGECLESIFLLKYA